MCVMSSHVAHPPPRCVLHVGSSRSHLCGCCACRSASLRKGERNRACAREMNDFTEKITRAKPEMMSILNEYRASGGAAIFELREASMELLMPLGLMRKERKSSIYVIVHPGNRYGDGLVPGHAIGLARDFAKDGFCLKEFGIPLATEVPPIGHPRRAHVIAWNKKLVADSNGILPSIDESHCVIMSAPQP